MIVNKLVHYIWVGTNVVPAHFMLNYENTKNLNPDYEFKIWSEADVIPYLDTYSNIFHTSSLFHKLQLSRYMISHTFGGICCDFDIEWKVSFDTITESLPDCSLVFPKRKGLHFYNRTQKTTMIDDFVIMAKPKILKSFLDYCLYVREHKKPDDTEPFSVYALTEWCLERNDVEFLTPQQIYSDPNSIFAYHHNKKTWNNTL